MNTGKTYQNYAYYAAKEIKNKSQVISDYAKLIIQEYEKLEKNEITLEEFTQNTLGISEDTELNYIRNCIILYYPN